MGRLADMAYRVNDHDQIVSVNPEWDEFATSNGGHQVTADRVLNRPLWDFITDPTTQDLYRQILHQIRSGRTVRFSFRCDAPECRRLLEMTVERAADGTTEFRTRTLSEEKRPTPLLLKSEAKRSADLLRVCGWCKRVHADGAWVEVEEAVDRLHLFHQSRLPAMTHGICEPCLKRMMETVKASRQQAAPGDVSAGITT